MGANLSVRHDSRRNSQFHPPAFPEMQQNDGGEPSIVSPPRFVDPFALDDDADVEC